MNMRITCISITFFVLSAFQNNKNEVKSNIDKEITLLVRMKIQKIRSQYKLDTFHFDPKIDSIAQYHALAMAKYSFFNHSNPHNKKMKEMRNRFEHFRYKFQACGENIAMQSYSGQTISNEEVAEQFIQQWINSAPHKKNLLNPIYKDMSVAVAVRQKSNTIEYYAVQNFGTKQ